MDRKNWPWRRKTSDKNVAATDGIDVSPSHLSELSEGQVTDKYDVLVSEKGIPAASIDTPSLSQDARSSLSAEEQIKRLNEKLLGALSEITAKDLVVKQHVKVAEEAVTGWEKAEAEAASFKQQLEICHQGKSALEDRITHLDGALKECMRRLRVAREEQEEAIHEALIKKSRDSERLRLELEARLLEMNEQFVQSVAEKSALEKALQERSRIVSELGDAKLRAESEVQVLQVRLDMLEKEKSDWKYELHMLNKEIDIRNQEKDYTRRAAEAAQKMHLEDVKKLIKLESECQRLRVLVKKKLPGPAALNQMKIEVEALDRDPIYRRRKSVCKAGGPPKNKSLDSLEEGSQTGSNDSEFPWEKLATMEEEAKVLKQALESKTKELEKAKAMYAETATKLSNVNQQRVSVAHAKEIPSVTSNGQLKAVCEMKKGRPSLTSVPGETCNGTEDNCPDAWASALILELENFKSEKFQEAPEKLFDSANVDLMDDFIEMERLASTMSSERPVKQLADADDMHARATSPNDHVDYEISVLRLALTTRERELQAANEVASGLTKKLSSFQEQLNVLQSKDSAVDRTMLRSPEEIDSLVQNQVEVADVDPIFKEGRVDAKKDVAKIQSPVDQMSNELFLLAEDSSTSSSLLLQPPCASSEESGSEAEANSSLSERGIKSKLEICICRLIHIVKLIVQQMGRECTDLAEEEKKLLGLNEIQDCESSGRDLLGEKWSNPTMDNYICKLMASGRNFLQGKIDSLEFITTFSDVLNCILDIGLSRSVNAMKDVSPVKELMQSAEDLLDPLQLPIGPLTSIEFEDCKVKGIEEETKNVLIPNVCSLRHSVFCRSDTQCHMSYTDKENNAFEASDVSKASSLQEEFFKLKKEKIELEAKLEKANDSIECLKLQISNAEHMVKNLQIQLASTEELKQLAEDRLETAACDKSQIEFQAKNANAEMNHLQEQVAALNVELDKERKNRQHDMAKLRHLHRQLSEGVSEEEIISQFSPERNGSLQRGCNEEARLQQEREISAAAEKLAQCQRTILTLGEQLKALAMPNILDSISPGASTELNTSLEIIYSSKNNLETVDNFECKTHKSLAHPHEQESSWSPSKDLSCERAQKSREVQNTKGTDNCRSSRSVPSSHHVRSMQTLSSNVPRSSLPCRSPVKFRPSKSRILNSTADLSKSLNAAEADSPPSEKLINSGFARFFSRTRSSHG